MGTVILGIIVFLVLAFVVYKLSTYVMLINRSFKTEEYTYGDVNSSKKALVLYAPSMHDSVDIIKKNTVDKLVSKGFSVKVNFPYEDLVYNYNDFDVICYISPVYMSKVSSALCEVMASSNYIKKKVFIISVGQNMDKKEELNYMKGLIEKDNEFSLIKLKKDELKKLNDFIEGALL